MKVVAKKQGFTLVELLVVLIIIGVLVAILVPRTLGAIADANVKKTAADLRAIDTAFQLCYSANNTWAAPCNSIASLRTNNYLEAGITADPFGITYVAVAVTGGGGAMESDKTKHFDAGKWPPTVKTDHIKL